MSPQIEKQQFRNQTSGWLGVSVIGPKGDENGVSVEPNGTVWLSEQEQILTANAPRDPKDNPFIAQTFIGENPDTGAKEEYELVPLIPINEGRFVPANDRPIPADLADGTGIAQAAATGDEPVVASVQPRNAHTRHEEVAEIGETAQPHDPPPVPPKAAEAAAAAEETPEPPQPPPAPVAPPVPPQSPEPDPGFPTVPEPEPVPEETAAESPGPEHEETGAALPPTGDAPEGEYAQAEEVGTPVQGSTPEDEASAESQPPPPPFAPEE
jgi:hypothetical protein